MIGQIGSDQLEVAPLTGLDEGGADASRRTRHENAHTLLLVVVVVPHSTTPVRHTHVVRPT